MAANGPRFTNMNPFIYKTNETLHKLEGLMPESLATSLVSKHSKYQIVHRVFCLNLICHDLVNLLAQLNCCFPSLRQLV